MDRRWQSVYATTRVLFGVYFSSCNRAYFVVFSIIKPINENKKQSSHIDSICVSLALFTFCDDVTIDYAVDYGIQQLLRGHVKMATNSYDFIPGDIHRRMCKKWTAFYCIWKTTW